MNQPDTRRRPPGRGLRKSLLDSDKATVHLALWLSSLKADQGEAERLRRLRKWLRGAA